tara:strand:+ start:347 stop:520 length:174 start_codon:yes stop_codon:yes gene_type:complete
MKAKNIYRPLRTTRRHRTEDPLPHEVGTHLFAIIRRNLIARREHAKTKAVSQLTFAF